MDHRAADESASPAEAAATDEQRESGPGPAVSGPRTRVWLALALVVVISAAALFVSGYALGTQRALTPGTTADQEQLFAPYWEAYDKIVSSYVGTYTPRTLIEGSIKGMFAALGDPFSAYMTSEEYQASLAGISGQFQGIGAEMTAINSAGVVCSQLGPACALRVVRIIRDSPAEKADLRAGDVITSIDGASVAGLALDDAVSRIRGPKGSQVRLGLTRAGAPLDLAITRDVVQEEDVIATPLDQGAVTDLKIASFSSSAADDFRTLLGQSLSAGVRRFVIDLRDDPGGFVDAADAIADQLMAAGPIYWEEDAAGRDTEHDADGAGIATDPGIQLAVLVNGGTASASEILTGALQDSGRATVIGTQTYGKGTIQQWILLSNDSGGFRLSIARWLTPDKTWIHGIGITPDIVLAQRSDVPLGQDPQLDRAVEVLTGEPEQSPAPGSAASTAGSSMPTASASSSHSPAPSPAGPSGAILPLISLASTSGIG